MEYKNPMQTNTTLDANKMKHGWQCYIIPQINKQKIAAHSYDIGPTISNNKNKIASPLVLLIHVHHF